MEAIAPFVQPIIIACLAVIGYLFQQNVVAMRQQITQLNIIVSKLQDAQNTQAIQLATVAAQVAERRRAHDIDCPAVQDYAKPSHSQSE